MAHAKDVSHDGDAGHEPPVMESSITSDISGCCMPTGSRGRYFLHGLSQEQVPECVAYVRKKWPARWRLQNPARGRINGHA